VAQFAHLVKMEIVGGGGALSRLAFPQTSGILICMKDIMLMKN
jgi:hypothetical protein